ncbi:hypothetical protein HHK36_018973 [Tetracentron sinense]|uniref:Uncharacterized protein n=1 Tax=Tetracentron sinense TaxID=13715 RepID=A0A834YT40_TETSI|nr:hypothetical protein HHK36_018973 [Tetracentron sinense]
MISHLSGNEPTPSLSLSPIYLMLCNNSFNKDLMADASGNICKVQVYLHINSKRYGDKKKFGFVNTQKDMPPEHMSGRALGSNFLLEPEQQELQIPTPHSLSHLLTASFSLRALFLIIVTQRNNLSN